MNRSYKEFVYSAVKTNIILEKTEVAMSTGHSVLNPVRKDRVIWKQ